MFHSRKGITLIILIFVVALIVSIATWPQKSEAMTIRSYIEKTMEHPSGKSFCQRYDDLTVETTYRSREEKAKSRLLPDQISLRIRRQMRGAFFAREAAHQLYWIMIERKVFPPRGLRTCMSDDYKSKNTFSRTRLI